MKTIPLIAILLATLCVRVSHAQDLEETARSATAPAASQAPSFQRRGLYLHGCWVMEHPFSVRSWQRQDFAAMFRLLKSLGYTSVMLWTTPETAPMPLSDEDAATLRGYRNVIDDAKAAGLECWFACCPNVISKDEVRSLPWKDRSLYASTEVIKLSDTAKAQPYLDHRRKVLAQVDNADGYVVIDGDPGSYPGAPIDEYLRILKNDQQAVPGKPVIPWLWSGWGRDTQSKGKGFWSEPVGPSVRSSLQAMKEHLTGDWELLPGRSHREGWANGRSPVAETQQAGLMPRSTIMCYEAIEFEPTEPALTLQFDLIRQVLKEERELSPEAQGVFGNTMCPVLVLPNLYFFARGAADPAYLDKPEREVLADLARELGDAEGVLVPAWSCLKLSLAELPADLPVQVRSLKLDTDLARNIPGGPQRYVEIIAAQVESRRGLLEAAAERPAAPDDAAVSLAKGMEALIDWWQVHRYVGMGRKGDPFHWRFLRPDQVEILREHTKRCAAVGPEVIRRAAQRVAEKKVLTAEAAEQLLKQLAKAGPPQLANASSAEFVPLFDGKTLNGWRNPYSFGEAKVVDGEIHLTANKKFFLVTDKTYRDFVFEGEVLLPEGPANSGFMFRAHAEPNKVFGYQAEVDSTDRKWSGGLYDEGRRGWFISPVLDDAANIDAFRKRAGETFRRHDWNTYRITCQGNHLQIAVNGVTTTDVEDATDAEGVIAIQHHGEKGQTYRFRNLRIQELKP